MGILEPTQGHVQRRVPAEIRRYDQRVPRQIQRLIHIICTHPQALSP